MKFFGGLECVTSNKWLDFGGKPIIMQIQEFFRGILGAIVRISPTITQAVVNQFLLFFDGRDVSVATTS